MGNLLEEALPEDYLELILEKSDTDLEKRYVKLISYGEQSETFKQRILENGLKIMSEEVGIILREAVPGDAKTFF